MSNERPMIRVLLADSTRVHAQLLSEALCRDPGFQVVGAVSHLQDLLEAARSHSVDILVVSANLDEEPRRGFEALRQLRAGNSALRAVALMDSSKREAILEAFRAGARGIFSRHESLETLSKCVRCVHEGQIWANSEQMGFAVEALAASPNLRAVDAKGLSLLSKRELDVVHSLAEGLTNREIAERLGLSQHTIKNYLFRVFDKLGVSSRVELLYLTLSRPANGAGTEGNLSGQSQDIEWCRRAAEQGVPTAQITLARMYHEGRNVAVDTAAAYMWYLIAERTGQEMKEEIGLAKRQLAETLSTDDILEAQGKVAEKMKKPSPPSGGTG